MTDTPQTAWMREYERRRSDLDNAAYDVGAARNGQDEERAEAVAAMARKALDAHVRTLVDALGEIAGLRMVAGDGFMPDSTSYLRPDQYYHRVQAIIARAALAATKDQP